MKVSEVTFQRYLSGRFPLATQNFKNGIKNVDLGQTSAVFLSSEIESELWLAPGNVNRTLPVINLGLLLFSMQMEL